MWADPELAGAYNFGPAVGEELPVRLVVELAREAYGNGAVEWSEMVEGPHEAGSLALDTTKARTVLHAEPRYGAADAVTRTIAWYRAQRGGANARDLCEAEIAAYEGSA